MSKSLKEFSDEEFDVKNKLEDEIEELKDEISNIELVCM